jgi:hypothetical protein
MGKRLLSCLAVLAVVGGTVLAQEPAGPGVPAPVVADGGSVEADGGSVEADGRTADNNRLWLSTDYLLWWLKKSPLPVPLVTTTSDLTSQPPAALGQSGTSIVLGNQDLGLGSHSGGRFGAGGWIDGHRSIGLEGDYFFLASRTVTQGVASTGQPGAPVLATPFFNADTAAESSFPLASPGTLAGGASLTLSDRLHGAEANGVVAVVSSPGLRFEVLGGFRYLDFRENLTFVTASTGIEPPDQSNNGLILNTLDQFDTDNRYYGWQVGVRGEYRFENLILGASVKLGLGDMDETTTINGAALTNFFNTPPGCPFTGVPAQVVPGSGTFAQPSNVGRTSRHVFVFVPEVAARVGYQFAPWARAFIGYDFLYVSNVARPGELIDRNFNVSQTVQNAVAGNSAAPGSLPAVNLTGSSFWAQGLNVGLEFRY